MIVLIYANEVSKICVINVVRKRLYWFNSLALEHYLVYIIRTKVGVLEQTFTLKMKTNIVAKFVMKYA